MDRIFAGLKFHLKDAYKDTIILTVTQYGRTIKQNGGLGTEHGYGTAIFMAGGLLKKSQVYTDWPGLKKKNSIKEEILMRLLMLDQFMHQQCLRYLI